MHTSLRALALAIACALLSSGCAFSANVPVNYTYGGPASGLTLPSMAIGEFTDSRNVPNNRQLLLGSAAQFQSTAQAQSGWLAEKPLAELVRDAVVQGEERFGHSDQAEASNLILTGDLINVEPSSVSGWSRVTYNFRLTVRLTVTDTSNGRIVWRDTLVANGTSQTGQGPTVVVGAFNAALDNLVERLAQDPLLRQNVAENRDRAS